MTGLSDLGAWVGRTQEMTGEISAFTARAMEAALDRSPSLASGDPLPALWHWLMPSPPQPASALGADGHPAKGGFLPPVPLPRRMWAGGDLRFHAPIAIGAPLTRRSRVGKVTQKTGRTGPLCFVTVDHSFVQDGALVLEERHDIVYRDLPPPDTHLRRQPDPQQTRPKADHAETIRPDSTLLFRYSALTFNGHRIHYDLDHCRRVEGYPGLVVHGPLIATFLADLCTRNLARPLRRFAFRAKAPLFHDAPFTIALRAGDTPGQVSAVAQGPMGGEAMVADAEAEAVA
ncbi:MAG: MaoC family dehydratase N-terminal domain-containing protein [Pseudomonadota bacterium]